MYGNVGEIYHRPAVMLWFLLHSESYCRRFVCTDRNEKWGGGRREKDTERERETACFKLFKNENLTETELLDF